MIKKKKKIALLPRDTFFCYHLRKRKFTNVGKVKFLYGMLPIKKKYLHTVAFFNSDLGPTFRMGEKALLLK